MQQADSTFSDTFKRGGSDTTTRRGLGLDGGGGKTISLYGRNSAPGTCIFFKEKVLLKGG